MLLRKFTAYIRLMRPANIVTAFADILMGYAASALVSGFPDFSQNHLGFTEPGILGLLLLSSFGLYGGGVVFNDFFDAETDRKERPERPIPSGYASTTGTAVLGTVLLLLGVASAAIAGRYSVLIASVLAALTLTYNFSAKHHSFLGPVNMGLCRGLNLMLGISASPLVLCERWYLFVIPLIYIAAVTGISRGEVQGGNKINLIIAAFIYALVFAAVFSLKFFEDYELLQVLPFIALWAYLVYIPLFKALKDPQPGNISSAVKAGVLSLIVLNASMAAGFAGWEYGLMILLLLPVSRLIAKYFAVT